MADQGGLSAVSGLMLAALLAYALATYAYLSEPRGNEAPVRNSVRALVLAALLHLATIGAQCVQGSHPFKSVALVISLGALLMVAAYTVLSAGSRPMRELGAVVSPCAAAALLLGGLSLESQVAPQVSSTAPTNLVHIHVALATIGLAGFCLSAGIAGLYLVMDRRLRRLDLRPGMSGLSLQWLDRVHAILVGSVTPVFVLAVIVGAMAVSASGTGMALLSERGLELAVSGVAFLATTTSLISRWLRGVRGRRSAWLTMVAFASMLVILISYGVRQ